MLSIFFLLIYRRKKSDLDRLSIGHYSINIDKLQNASVISIKNSKSLNKHGKYYVIFIKNKKSFFKSNLSLEYNYIFKSYNCIIPSYFRFYLRDEEFLKLHKSQYLSIFEVPKQLKYHETTTNKNTKKINTKSQNPLCLQFIVQASTDFPKYFNKYGVIHKIFEELYSFTLNQENFSQKYFNNYVESIKNDLINSDFVFKFEISPRINLLNRFAIGYVQTGIYEMKNYNNMIQSYNPLHDISITGTNEVVTISDSGLSPNIDWFVDPNQPTYPYNKYDSSQRKIIYYSQYNSHGSTDRSDTSGHGTHVAGTVLGNSINSNKLYSLFNGAAPDAKAIIVDLEDAYGNMYIDVGLEQTLNRMKQCNSFINTNSWGLDADSTTVNLLYNSAAILNPEILFIFAAGNNQRYQGIYSPGSAKNVLTVGALENIQTANLNSTQSALGKNINFEVLIDNEKQKLFSAHSLNYNDNSDNDYKNFGFKSIISEMNNKNGINTIYDSTIILYNQNQNDYTDKAVIVSNCEEAKDSLTKNAKVIIVKSSNDFGSSSCIDTELQQRAFGLEFSLTSSQLQLLNGKKLTITPQIISNEYPSVAYYSSRGPNYLGGIKPEIVAPGTDITSASRISSSTPQLAVMSGTSMSTPLVAGAMATLRQYLREKKGMSNKRICSHLLKAIAIASADKPNPKVPDFEYGFGRLNLANVIPEIASNELKMEFLTDLKLEGKSVYLFTFEVTSRDKYDVRVAFSYLDDSTQSSDALIIKANMNVQTPDKDLLFPLGDELEDSFSTSERIYIPKAELSNGLYTIIISTSEPFINSAIYASIVVSGSVRNLKQITDIEASSSVQNTFDWSQYCKTDNTLSSTSSASIASTANNYHECNCNQYSSGLLCQFKSKSISFGDSDIIRLGPFETCYFYSTLNVDTYSNLIFNWEQSNNQQNYIMLRLNIGSSKKRLSQYQYHFYSNKTKSSVGGPANANGDAILYEKGTLFFFTYTNFGQNRVALTISSVAEKPSSNKNSPISVSLSVSLYLVIIVIILIVIVIIFITCRKRKKRNAQIEGATSSSVSSSSGATYNDPNSNRHRSVNEQNQFSIEQPYQNQQRFYGTIPNSTYGNRMILNPYYNDMNYSHDPNAFPEPEVGDASYCALNNAYYPTGEDNSDTEQAPQYFPPSNNDNPYKNSTDELQNKKDNDDAEPINPYLNNVYQNQQYDSNMQNMYDY